MTEAIFYEIILFVETKGYKGHLGMLPMLPVIKTSADLLAQKILWQRRYEIIFSNEFAIALWGKEIWKNYAISIPEWQYKLQRMVIKVDPLKYLLKEYERLSKQ